MEADTAAQEVVAKKDFQEDRKASKIEIATRTKESEMKTQEKKRRSDKVTELAKSLKSGKGEAEAIDQYLKDLQPACVSGDSSYEDRKAARASEIDGLHE